MRPATNGQRLAWMGLGLIAGLAIASLWPHEVAHALATDRDSRFAVCTVEVGQLNPDAIFVLDFLTGRLRGAMLNQQTGTFTNSWFRNVAADFQVNADNAAKAKYAIIPGRAGLNSGGGSQMAAGVIYIGELTSGKVGAYRFQFKISKTPLPIQNLEPFDYFSFREESRE